MRPNIRVEIRNNLAEAMDVDENEEGEISDNEGGEVVEKQSNDMNKPAPPGLLLDEDRLRERARRFCLNPSEIKNFKDEDLQLLHSSLGITPSTESNVRYEVIHLRGIEQMNAADILDYFLEYAPVSVEWIDEGSCNVLWSDKMSAARALHFMSKPVRGMPVRDDANYFDNLQESEEIVQSVLVLNKNREIELKEDDDTGSNKFLNEENSVDVSEITTTIPPGYWRLGKNHPKSKCLLLRFALKSDKKHFKTEQFSRYYKNFGKKDFKVSVKPPKERQIETHGIFGRNKEMRKTGDNPWTVLAKNWDEDAQFRERERNSEETEPKLEVKNSLRNRLGNKRKEEEEKEEEDEIEEAPPKKKRVKIPRMRMYADEEEEKIKRKKMLQRINNQIQKIDQNTSTNSDLRTILNMTSRTHGVQLERAEPEVFDLGTRLKNRSKKMVFQIKTEGQKRDSPQHKEREREPTRRRYSNSDDNDDNDYDSHSKTRSKVAVVIRTQKKPAVASAVNSTLKARMTDPSESESESESSETEDSSGSEEEEEEEQSRRVTSRPGFSAHSHSHATFKNPLKIEINNDHFKKSF